MVGITTPADGLNVALGSLIDFAATATDAEDGDLSASLLWTSDLDGTIGVGASFQSGLSVGTHTITTSVTDSGAETGTDSITVTVDPDAIPEIMITAPADGSSFNIGDLVNFMGMATDNEDADISTAINWTSSINGVIGMGADFSLITLSAGMHTITAEVTDSALQTVSTSITVTINDPSNTPPVVTITSPGDGSMFDFGDSISFAATAIDVPEGDLAANLSWTSDLDGAIGTGASFSTNALTVGMHTITASVTDSGSLPGSDAITVIVDSSGQPKALIQVTPLGDLGASTFGGTGAFVIQNTGDVDITSLTMDLSSGILPDIVFDPTGFGGDATAQCFSPDLSLAAAVGLTTPSTEPASCSAPFSQARQGGFDVITLDFTGFNPGETFTFSTDIDPNSIQGVPGAGNAGAVSGYEMVGATVTATFADGSTLVGTLFEDGSLGGSEIELDATAPAAPSIVVAGQSSPAIVTDTSQTIVVTGTPGADIELLVMDSRLYIATGAPPFNVPNTTFYANEAMSGKTVYTATIGAGGTVAVPITLLATDSGDATPDGGLNQILAVELGSTSAVSNQLVLKYDPSGGGSTEVDLSAVQDSFTRGATPASNHGGLSFMRVRAFGEKVSFAGFDASALSGQSVTAATLQLTVNDLLAAGSVQVHEVLGPWSEGTITHDTRPPIGAPVISQTVSSAGLVEIDITSIVQNWAASPTTAYGIAITATNNDAHITFQTSEGANPPVVQVSLAGGGGGLNDAPVVGITTPADGLNVALGSLIDFAATATDAEDGDLSASLLWTSDLDGTIGVGASFQSGLSVGTHTITTSVTDSGAETGTDSITVTVDPDAIPEIMITAPADGSSFNIGDLVNFMGMATDNEDADISTAINWTSSINGVIGMGADFSLITLSAGMHTITAEVTDSALQTVSTSITVTINDPSNTPPVVTITSPGDGSMFDFGDSISFAATAIDVPEGDLAANLSWTSDLDGAIGTGASFSTNALTVGMHTITASVTDSGSLPGSDAITVIVDSSGQPKALIQVTPLGDLGASTFGGTGAFVIQNTGDVDITSLTMDLSSGILPDIVFDPTGFGGDATAQCFSPDLSLAAAVGLTTPSTEPASCSAPFSQARQGGFDVITLDFTGFNPGETFTFSTDIDPNSIQGVPGAGNAGAVSGYEMVGATVTATFADGSTLVGTLFEDGSLGGSEIELDATAPAAPSIVVAGQSSPAIVTDTSQTIVVTGTPGADIELLVMDSRLYIATGAPPFNVPNTTFYANEAMSGKTVYTATIGAGGTVAVPITLLATDSGDATPDGGLNQILAVELGSTSAVSNQLVLKYDPSGGGSTEVDLSAVQDSFTRGATPASNHGGLSFMRVRAFGEKVSFAGFDASALSGQSVTAATLQLTVNDLLAAGSVQVHEVLGPWSEGTITHDTRPPIGAPVISQTVSSAGLVEIDITSIVQNWAASPTTAYGIAITATNNDAHITFQTSEGANPPVVQVSILVP